MFDLPLLCQQATSKQTTENQLHVAHVHQPEDSPAYLHVSPFYSKSSSFLKLMQVSEQISCDKDVTVRVQYIIQGQELKKEQQVLDFFYLVGVMSCSHSFNTLLVLCSAHYAINRYIFLVFLCR